MATTPTKDITQQFIRKCDLFVSTLSGTTLDLSKFRVKFQVKQTQMETPNAASIRVYNLSQQSALDIRNKYKKVILQAGYEGNFGIIFQGNIKQVIVGRENATDTFIDIIAGDGDLGYNFAVVNMTLAKNSSPQDQVNAAVKAMKNFGVSAGGNAVVNSTTKLPRGKVLYGNAKNILRNTAKTVQADWFIQEEKVVFVPKKHYLPGTPVVINASTGMVGTPQQTNYGVDVKCLINPSIKISGRIKLDNETIQLLTVDLTLKPGNATNTQAPLPSNGVYLVLAIQHTGDTRGTDWYTTLICNYIDSSTVLANSVSNG